MHLAYPRFLQIYAEQKQRYHGLGCLWLQPTRAARATQRRNRGGIPGLSTEYVRRIIPHVHPWFSTFNKGAFFPSTWAQSPTASSFPSLASGDAPMSHHQKLLQRRPPAPWSMEDELALLDAHVEEGNKWAAIANRMPGGRSHIDVKVRGTYFQGFDHGQP